MTSNDFNKKYLSILEQIEQEHAINDETHFDINSRVLILDGL
tara:strand:- start:151 stop:276 length:126 start_codon:yes stop_codon:yes gene_type:complete